MINLKNIFKKKLTLTEQEEQIAELKENREKPKVDTYWKNHPDVYMFVQWFRIIEAPKKKGYIYVHRVILDVTDEGEFKQLGKYYMKTSELFNKNYILSTEEEWIEALDGIY